MRWCVLWACLGVTGCGVIEAPEMRALRQAIDGGGCTMNSECPNGHTCVDNSCICGTGGPCGLGATCVNGACSTLVFDAGPPLDGGVSGQCWSTNDDEDVVCEGAPGMELGASVSLCDAQLFAAGAPGTSTVLQYTSGSTRWLALSDPSERAGEAVLCRATEPTLAAGPTGLFRADAQGAMSRLWSLPAFALAPYVDPTWPSATPTALATADTLEGDRTLLRLTSGGVETTVTRPPPFGASLATSPDGQPPLIAVGAPLTTGGAVYTLRPSTTSQGFEVVADTDDLNSYARAGVAVAIGNVWPDRPDSDAPVNEVLVATDAYVLILSGDLRVLRKILLTTTLGGVSNRPASLAIEEAPLVPGGNLHAFYIGTPGNDAVLRCVGTRCPTWKTGPQTRSDFGAALSQRGNKVLVGAPAANDGAGAVYLYERPHPNLMGELTECSDTAACCTSNAVPGICFGGVFCQTTSSLPSPECMHEDGGAPDAGDDDAGLPNDAGFPEDAGAVDAGHDADAGVADGGTSAAPAPVEFAARGCSSAAGVWGALVVLLARRRTTTRVKEP